MKKLLPIILLAFAVCSAKSIEAPVSQGNQAYTPEIINTDKIKILPGDEISPFAVELDGKRYSHNAQAEQFKSARWRQNEPIFGTYSSHANPFVYDPVSNAMFYAVSWRYVANQGDPLTSYIRMIYSLDNGNTWESYILWEETNNVAAWTSLAVVNSNNMTNLDTNSVKELNYFAYNVLATNDGAGNYPWNGGQVTVNDGGSPYTEKKLRPQNNGTGTLQRWWQNNIATYYNQSTGKTNIILAGMLNSEENQPYGYYGVMNFDYMEYGYTYDGIPNQLSLIKFFQSDQLGTSYSAPVAVDVDNDGNSYYVVNNIMANDPEFANRKPYVVKFNVTSAQFEENFEPLPISLFQEFAASKGYPNYGNSYPYVGNGFVVTGVNEWSYFYKFVVSNDTEGKAFLIETYYKNGQWGLREIAEFKNSSAFVVLDRDDVHSDATGQLVYWVRSSVRGNEIQAAKTPNGDIVLKWVDYNGEAPIPITPALRYTNATAQGGEIFEDASSETTDIFLAYKLAGANSWSERKYVTSDEVFYKDTWLPRNIGSVNKVPIMCSVADTANGRADELDQTSNFGRQMYIGSITNTLYYLHADAPQLKTVYDPPKVDVKDTPERPNLLNNIAPNPVTGSSFEVSYTLAQPQHFELAIYNSIGEKVLSIFDGFSSEGQFAQNVLTNKLTSGTYYITMKASQGETYTRILNVLK